jgi:hypothetical protein
MLYDEGAVFGGGPLEDAQHIKTSSPKKSLNKPDILSNRSKTSGGKSSLVSRPHIVERYSSEESPKCRPVKLFDVDALLTPPPVSSDTNAEIANDPETNSDDDNPLSSGGSGYKVDSKNDFVST